MTRIRKGAARAGAALTAAALAACATQTETRDLSITIPYDPATSHPGEAAAQAQAHCEAYGLRAVFVDETIDRTAARLRHRRFECR